MKDGVTVALDAAVLAMKEREIEGMATDAVLAFAFVDKDGEPKLAMYATETLAATLGLATWMQGDMLDKLVNAADLDVEEYEDDE